MNKYCDVKGCPRYRTLFTGEHSIYCAACGKELKENQECPYCKHEIYPSFKFCEFCGRSCL